MFLPVRGLLTALLLTLTVSVGCVSPEGDTLEARRNSALTMRDQVLEEATETYPGLQSEIDGAVGYMTLASGIFKTIIGHVGGYAVAVDQESKEETVMKHSAWCFGPLLEFGTARAVAVVHDREVFDALLRGDISWNFGADVDASFRFGDFGGDVSAATVHESITLYRMFQTGLGLNACVFWVSFTPDAELNP